MAGRDAPTTTSSSLAQQFVAQLPATTDAAGVAATQQQQLPPHFGSKLAAQLFQSAEQSVPHALPDVPQLPRVGLELPKLPTPPSVQLPQFQMPDSLPSLPDSSSMLEGINSTLGSSAAAASSAADALAHLPQQTQQQLQLLLTQLQELNSSNSTLQPHFGSHALLAWLQAAADAVTSALQSAVGGLHVPAVDLANAGVRGIDISSGPAVLGSVSSSILGSVTDTLSSQGLAGVGASTKANVDALAASLQVLSASAAATLPAGVSSGLTQGAHTVQQQVSALAGSVQHLQGLLLTLSQTLQHLPETGAGGYSFATLCLVAAGTLAALAASVPPADAVAGGRGDQGAGVLLTHEYDPAAVEAYFKQRPVLVAQRSLQLGLEVAGFGLSLLGDLATNRLQVRKPNNRTTPQQQLSGVGQRSIEQRGVHTTRHFWGYA